MSTKSFFAGIVCLAAAANSAAGGWKRLSIKKLLAGLVCLAALALPRSADALERVTLRRDGREIEIAGRLLLTAEDGGLLVQTPDGTLWTVEPADLVRHASDDAPFAPLSAEEMSAKMLGELPPGFKALPPTAHYQIFYNTSRPYADWCAALFEQLYRAFTNYWTQRGFELSEPEFPLTAVVFADRRSYREFSRPELGEAADAIIAYYSLASNRMVLYDLTGLEALGMPDSRKTSAQIKRILAQPGAAHAVSTIVHEATHQIAFNCGLHVRYSDCPLWFTEGIAVYFETPNLSSDRGWRNIGAINRPRLEQFQRYLRTRPADSLEKLIASDERLRDTKQGLDAYAEAWALTYFLLRQYPQQYVKYLEGLSRKKPMVWDTPEARLAEFRQAFGDDLARLDQDFIRYMLRVK